MAKIIIEEINLLGHVTKFHTFDHFPIRIGRGFHNDLILSDIYISPSHVEIQQLTEGWEAKDLDSKNGTVIRNRTKSTATHQLLSGDDIVIGKTKLRLLSSSHPVQETRSLVEPGYVARNIGRPIIVVPICVLAIMVFILDVELQIDTKTSFTKILTGALPLFIFSLLWAGTWAFVGRVLKHKANFMIPFVSALLFSVSSIVVSGINGYTSYIANSNMVGGTIENILSGLTFSALLYFSLCNSTLISRNKNLVASHAIAWTLVAFTFISEQSEQVDFNHNAVFPSELMPPILHINHSQSLEEFMQQSELMFDHK